MSGCSQNLAKRLAILPMFLCISASDTAWSVPFETLTRFSWLGELMVVLATLVVVVVSSPVILPKKKMPNL